MDRLACKRQVWSALSSGGEQDLHQAVWDVTLNELHSGSCSYRQALLDALDVTAVTDATSTIRLVQRHIQLAQAGSSQAQCFAGVLLSLYSPLDGHGGTHQHSQGFRYLLSSHYQHNNLATLFLALCYEAARGTERSVESALECYQTAFTRGYQIAHILFLESSRDHGAGAASKPAATSQASSDYQADLAFEGSATLQRPPPPPLPPPSTSQHSSSPSLDLLGLQDILLNGHEPRRGSSSNTTIDSMQAKDLGSQANGWEFQANHQERHTDLQHVARDQMPAVDPPDSPKSTSSASVLQSSEDLLSRSLEDMLDGLEQLPPSMVYGKDSKAAGQPGALMANPADDEAGSANAFPLRPMTWPSVLGSGLTNGHGIKEGQQAEGGNPWGNLQTGGQVDWSIRPKAASLAAADKPSSRSASPAPSTVSARSLPNLNVPEAGPKAPSQDGQSSPRGDPLAGMSSAEIQRHMARQAMVAAREEAGTLSDKSSTSHDSPVGSLADSAGGGPGLGDKPARQAASEPSIEEADQLQGALSRWCSSAHSSEDEAVILASSYIPADIKEAVCSTSPQVRQNMMSMLHALLFPGSEPQASKAAQPAQAPQASGEPPASLPSGDMGHQLKLGAMASKQPAPPPRRKAQGGLQPALPKPGSNNPRAASPGLPGAGMPMASMGELYGLPAQRGNPLLVPAQYNGPAALGRQMPLGTGPSVQALRSNNQASEAQQAMLMQVLAQQNARAPDLAKSGQLPGRSQTQLPRNLRPAAGQLGQLGQPNPNGRPRGLNPLQPMPAPLAGQSWGPGGQLLPRPIPPLPRPHERAYSPLLAVKPGLDRPSLGYNTQAGLRGAQLLGTNGPMQGGAAEALASQAAWLGNSLPAQGHGAGMPGAGGLADWPNQAGDPLALHLSASQQRLLQARAGLGPAPPSRAPSSLGFDAVNNMYLANPAPDRAVPGDLWRANQGSRPYDLSAAQLQGSQVPPDMARQLLSAGLHPSALNSNELSHFTANNRITPNQTGLAPSAGWSTAHAQNLYSAAGQLKPGMAVSGPRPDKSYAGLQDCANPLLYNNSYRST